MVNDYDLVYDELSKMKTFSYGPMIKDSIYKSSLLLLNYYYNLGKVIENTSQPKPDDPSHDISWCRTDLETAMNLYKNTAIPKLQQSMSMIRTKYGQTESEFLSFLQEKKLKVVKDTVTGKYYLIKIGDD